MKALVACRFRHFPVAKCPHQIVSKRVSSPVAKRLLIYTILSQHSHNAGLVSKQHWENTTSYWMRLFHFPIVCHFETETRRSSHLPCQSLATDQICLVEILSTFPCYCTMFHFWCLTMAILPLNFVVFACMLLTYFTDGVIGGLHADLTSKSTQGTHSSTPGLRRVWV